MSILHNISTNLSNTPLSIEGQGGKEAGHSEVAKAVDEISQKNADQLQLIGLTLQYAAHRLRFPPYSPEAVFQKGKIICTTSNYGKYSDLASYISLEHKPYQLSEEALEQVSKTGRTIQSTTVAPKPLCGGHCFGNGMVFSKKWLENPNIKSIAEDFQGGSPLKGAIYQEGHEKLLKSFLFDSGKEVTEKELYEASFANGGLTIDNGCCRIDDAPGNVLRVLSTLNPGAYQLVIPSFNSSGQRSGSHAIGLIIDTHSCYILDSNVAIGSTSRQDLCQTMGRLFTEYTGFDYSKNLDGTPPSYLTKVSNTLKGRANPPSAPLTDGFHLLKVTKSARASDMIAG
jgi:hypothetical protein